jgi:hypothetical protein
VKKLFALLVVVALAVGVTGTALAADEGLAHSGRVIIVAGGDVEVASDEQADAVVVFDGDARVGGTVNTLIVVDGTATVAGGTVETVAIARGTADLLAGATVLGDVLRFDATVERDDGATVGGSVKDMAGDVAAFGFFLAAAAAMIWIGFGIATLIVGLLMAGMAARQVRRATSLISREPVATGLVGLLSIVVIPLVAVLAMVTVIGIPTGVGLLIVVWPLMAFVGYIVAAIWIGEWLLNRREGAVPAERPYAAAVVGLLITFVIGFVPLAGAIVSIFGFGAVVLAIWRTLRGGGTAQPSLAPQPAPAA